MPDVTSSYGTQFDFMSFFGYFHILLTTMHDRIIESLPNFQRLCIYLMFIFWYVNMLNGYRVFFDLAHF